MRFGERLQSHVRALQRYWLQVHGRARISALADLMRTFYMPSPSVEPGEPREPAIEQSQPREPAIQKSQPHEPAIQQSQPREADFARWRAREARLVQHSGK